MAQVSTPVISKGDKITPTKRPFLGLARVNKVIAACNAVITAQVKVNVVTSSGDPIIDAQTLPISDWTFDAHGNSILSVVVPISPASSGTNTPGWHWTAGSRNYNPASTYQDQTLVFVSPSSAAVTTGLPDIDTGHTEKSVAGVWVALKTVVPSGTNYHVPRLPLPVPEDMDSSSNYWLLVSQAPQCV